jgi:hypothetical protein
MAATFSQLAGIATQGTFQLRVKLSMLSTAVAVYTELGTTPGHAARAIFATKVLLNQGFDLSTVAFMVLTASGNIAANANAATLPDYGIADNDINSQISAAWNAMAGA